MQYNIKRNFNVLNLEKPYNDIKIGHNRNCLKRDSKIEYGTLCSILDQFDFYVIYYSPKLKSIIGEVSKAVLSCMLISDYHIEKSDNKLNKFQVMIWINPTINERRCH